MGPAPAGGVEVSKHKQHEHWRTYWLIFTNGNTMFRVSSQGALVAPCDRATPHGRRPPGGGPRAAPGASRARPQAAARLAAGAAARPGRGQQGGPRGAGGAEGGGEQGPGGRRRAARRRRANRCRGGRHTTKRCDQPRLLRLRPAAVRDGRRPGEASGVPDLPRAQDTDDVLVRRQLPRKPWRLEAARAGTQVGEENAEE